MVIEEKSPTYAPPTFARVQPAEYSDPRNRRARYFTAAGSAGETLAAVRVAVAWGIVGGGDAEKAVVLLKRIIPMLWTLTRG